MEFGAALQRRSFLVLVIAEQVNEGGRERGTVTGTRSGREKKRSKAQPSQSANLRSALSRDHVG